MLDYGQLGPVTPVESLVGSRCSSKSSSQAISVPQHPTELAGEGHREAWHVQVPFPYFILFIHITIMYLKLMGLDRAHISFLMTFIFHKISTAEAVVIVKVTVRAKGS